MGKKGYTKWATAKIRKFLERKDVIYAAGLAKPLRFSVELVSKDSASADSWNSRKKYTLWPPYAWRVIWNIFWKITIREKRFRLLRRIVDIGVTTRNGPRPMLVMSIERLNDCTEAEKLTDDEVDAIFKARPEPA